MDKDRPIQSEFDSLWEILGNLKRLLSDISADGTDRIKKEIIHKLGFFPSCFVPAEPFPVLLESLWRQHRAAYYDNPLPEIFKVSLLCHLSRYCGSSWPVVVYACRLRDLGMSSGDIRNLIERPVPSAEVIEQALETLAGFPRPVMDWPVDPAFTECLITLSSAVFLGLDERCVAELQKTLGTYYEFLTALFVCAGAFNLWMETHPETGYEQHPVVRRNFLSLTQEEPCLVEIFQKRRAKKRWDTHGDALKLDEQCQGIFENMGDIFYTHDFEGNLLSVNSALERIAGYTRAEALQMKITDMIAPGHERSGQKMLDPRIVHGVPLHHEFEILSKTGSRIVLDAVTTPIFCGGEPVAVRGAARDVTERKQAETALREAHRELEARVIELEQRADDMALLNEMSDILRACHTSEEACNVIVRFVQKIFPAKTGALYLITDDRDSVKSVSIWGDNELATRDFVLPECWALRRSGIYQAGSGRSGLICRHVPHSESYLCIPLMAQSETLGVLHLTQPENITEGKQRLAFAVAEHIAMALSNLKLQETLRNQSIRDPLTGLFNRRFMEESLELEIRRAVRNQRPLGMIMIDLDHFKYFNDNFGHEVGDLLLKELGALLRANIRGEDIACRYGGEEFILILPEGNRMVTRQRADFYKDAIQRLNIPFKGMPLGRITASMGVAILPDHGRTAKSLIEAADKALYRSKAEGRDRVTMAG